MTRVLNGPTTLFTRVLITLLGPIRAPVKIVRNYNVVLKLRAVCGTHS